MAGDVALALEELVDSENGFLSPRIFVDEQLYARDDQGTRLLDTTPPGHRNAIDNIALNGNSLMLSWTHAGVKRALQLR